MKKKVVIIQKTLPQYRIDFFNNLRSNLRRNNVELTLIYGNGNKQDALKRDEAKLDWAIYVPNKILKLKLTELYWQPCYRYLIGADLVIAEQANKLLINYLLAFKRLNATWKFAFWGHGKNRQSSPTSVGNIFKTFFLSQCNWWFAYTENVKKYLIDQSYPASKITCVQNAIDTTTLLEAYSNISPQDVINVKTELNINSENVAIYCGGIYKEKRISFLLEACDLIKEELDDFQLIVIGSGAEVQTIKDAAKDRNWIHYLGPKFGPDRAKYFKISSAFLMPGLVGLAVLDSFALQTPMITTNFPYHSPEIEYLQHNINGLIVEDNVNTYAKAVVNFLQDTKLQNRLIVGCQNSAADYTLDKMVHNFTDGILQCLNS